MSVCIFQNGSEYELAAVLFLCSEFFILEANALKGHSKPAFILYQNAMLFLLNESRIRYFLRIDKRMLVDKISKKKFFKYFLQKEA